MKKDERDRARKLRKQGKSLNEIAKEVGVSKASVSYWVRDVPLTMLQRKGLNANGFSIDAIEKRRINRIAATQAKHRATRESAKKHITTISEHDLLLLGTALYWGEGGKTKTGMARIANTDPSIIKMMMRFFREIHKVPESKFRGHVHTFSHQNATHAEKYWSSISGIPTAQFYKTYTKPSIASLQKRETLPYGTFQIYVCDTTLFLTIMGTIEKLSEFST